MFIYIYMRDDIKMHITVFVNQFILNYTAIQSSGKETSAGEFPDRFNFVTI